MGKERGGKGSDSKRYRDPMPGNAVPERVVAPLLKEMAAAWRRIGARALRESRVAQGLQQSESGKGSDSKASEGCYVADECMARRAEKMVKLEPAVDGGLVKCRCSKPLDMSVSERDKRERIKRPEVGDWKPAPEKDSSTCDAGKPLGVGGRGVDDLPRLPARLLWARLQGGSNAESRVGCGFLREAMANWREVKEIEMEEDANPRGVGLRGGEERVESLDWCGDPERALAKSLIHGELQGLARWIQRAPAMANSGRAYQLRVSWDGTGQEVLVELVSVEGKWELYDGCRWVARKPVSSTGLVNQAEDARR